MKTHRITGGGGVELHVAETGNPRGRPIVFLHGASQCGLQWGRQMDSSLTEQHRLVAVDMHGHGLSDKPRDGYGDSKQWADDVDAMSLLAPGFLGVFPQLLATEADASVDGLRGLLRLCFANQPNDADFFLMLGYNVSVPPYVRQGLFSRSFSNADLLPKLRKPVLITHGELDAVVKPVAADQHKRAIPHAEVHLMANAGHAAFWDDAPAFNERLRAFCERL